MLSFHITTVTRKVSKWRHSKLYTDVSVEHLYSGNQTGETQVFRPDVLRNVEEQVRMIRDNLRVA
jgi:hypothetical protein